MTTYAECRLSAAPSPFPFMRPDWREECAGWTAEQRRVWRLDRDLLLHRLSWYFERRRTAGWEPEIQDHPGLRDVHMATQLRENPTVHLLLRAAILARRTPEEIQKDFQIEAGVLDTYEKCFFAARPYLGAEMAILCYLQFCEKDFQLIGGVAFCMGWDALRAVMSHGPVTQPVTEEVRGAIEAKIIKDGLLASHSVTVSSKNAAEVIERAIRLRKLDEVQQRRRGAGARKPERVEADSAEKEEPQGVTADDDAPPPIDLRTDELRRIRPTGFGWFGGRVA